MTKKLLLPLAAAAALVAVLAAFAAAQQWPPWAPYAAPNTSVPPCPGPGCGWWIHHHYGWHGPGPWWAAYPHGHPGGPGRGPRGSPGHPPATPPHRRPGRVDNVTAARVMWAAYRAIIDAEGLYKQVNATNLKPILVEAVKAYSEAYKAYKNGDYVEAVAWARVALSAAKSFTWAALYEQRQSGAPVPPPPPPPAP